MRFQTELSRQRAHLLGIAFAKQANQGGYGSPFHELWEGGYTTNLHHSPEYLRYRAKTMAQALGIDTEEGAEILGLLPC